MSKIKVFIDGSAGTTGLRIHSRLYSRQDVDLITLSDDKRKDLNLRVEASKSADVVFLCLPDAASLEIVEALGNSPVKILDTSTAHRTNPAWAYGFPELSPLYKEKILISNRIAVPGCHASGFCSVIAPLVQKNVIPADYPIACTSITGYSGGGKQMISDYQEGNRDVELNSPRQYALSQMHKHLPEMKAICGLDFEPAFSPVVADFYSGMTVTIPIFSRLLDKKYTAQNIHEILSEHYSGQKLVSVMPFSTDGMLGTNNLSGKDNMQIFVMGNDDRILLASRFDNLGKGASGAALQCFNLITNSDECEGLAL